MKPAREFTALQLALAYVLLAAVALVVSDALLVRLVDEPATLRRLQALKGGVEIVVTGVLILVLVRRSRRSLEASNERLEQQRQALQVLYRVLRHNLRNDINVVQGHATTLASEVSDPEKEGHIDHILRRAEKIAQYTGRLEAIRDATWDEIDGGPVDLVDLVPRLAASVCEDHDREADVAIDLPDAAVVEGSVLLEAALVEVIDNAITHNDSAVPEVRITVERDDQGGRIEVRVADNGPGIPEAERLPLQREEETPLVHGSGLGLWLVHWTVEQLDGELHFDGNDPRGSVVTIRLPPAEVRYLRRFFR